MIIDITGTELTPGNNFKDCLGNGENYDENGILIECCCDECDYYICCLANDWEAYYDDRCVICDKKECPRYRGGKGEKCDSLKEYFKKVEKYLDF